MTSLRPFQIVLLGVFGLLAIISLVLISTFSGGSSQSGGKYGRQVIIWGTLDTRAFDQLFSVIEKTDNDFSVVRYYEVPAAQFESEFVNAVAEGRSPDLIVLESERLVGMRSKLSPIGYEYLSLRDFKDRFVDGAEIFALKDGIYALPFAVDPLVMYWNRDLFNSVGIAQPPATWEEVVGSVVPTLTKSDATGRTIERSALAFGGYSNIRHAKQVLLTLATQVGSGLVVETDRGYSVNLNQSVADSVPPMLSALEFYTAFGDAAKPSYYSWNNSEPMDQDAFIASDLALYFGRGSEAKFIESRNPNLNFDLAPVPQGAGATILRTYGTFYGLAVPKAAINPEGGYAAAQVITGFNTALASADYPSELARALLFAPVTRTALARGSADPTEQVAYRSALIARSWLDPNPTATSDIFRRMVEEVVSNRRGGSESVGDAIDRIVLEF